MPIGDKPDAKASFTLLQLRLPLLPELRCIEPACASNSSAFLLRLLPPRWLDSVCASKRIEARNLPDTHKIKELKIACISQLKFGACVLQPSGRDIAIVDRAKVALFEWKLDVLVVMLRRNAFISAERTLVGTPMMLLLLNLPQAVEIVSCLCSC